MGSASRDCRSENVRVHAVIVAELKLRDVQRQIFAADFMEASDDPTFENRPKAFNCIGMDRADDVLPSFVIHNAVGYL